MLTMFDKSRFAQYHSRYRV